MGSNAGARLLLVLGFIAASVGYDVWILSHVVLDPSTTGAAAHALLDAPAVRKGLADQLSGDLAHRFPAASADPRVGPAVDEALRDPRVVAAFADTITRLHRAVLADDPTGTYTVGGHALTNALHDQIAPTDPQLAAQILRAPPLDLTIAPKGMPHLHDARPTANVVALLATLAALLLISAALLLRHDRRSIVRVGRRVAFLSLMPLVVFVVLPRVLAHAGGDPAQITAALLRVYGDRVWPSAAAILAAGAAIMAGAFLWPRPQAPERASAPVRRAGYAGPVPAPPGPGGRPDSTDRLYL